VGSGRRQELKPTFHNVDLNLGAAPLCNLRKIVRWGHGITRAGAAKDAKARRDV
jgi:hypothetical protein